MKEFLSFIKKEFRHIFRDRRTILIVLVMPIVQIILFGFAVSTEVHDARVDVVGDLADPSVRQTVARIDQNPYLHVTAVLGSVAEVAERFRAGKSDVAVCFERNFDERLRHYDKAFIRILGDGSDPNTAQMIVNYVNGVLSIVQSELSASEGTQTASFPHVQYMYNPAVRSSYNFVPGVMGLILMLVCSMMTAISIVREKESGTLELLLVSPIRPVGVIVSKAIPYLALSLINLVTILLLARFVLGVPLRGSLFLLAMVSVLFILASLGIGLLISVVSATQKTALLISGMGLTMPTMIFSGIIFPCESMPVILQYVSDIIPAKWYIIMIKKVMIEGVGFSYIYPEFIILLVMTLFLLVVSVRLFKRRL